MNEIAALLGLGEQHVRLYERLAEGIYEDDEEMWDVHAALKEVRGQVPENVNACVLIDAAMETEEEAIRVLSARLAGRAVALAKRRLRLRDAMLTLMDETGITKVKGPCGSVSVQSRDHVVLDVAEAAVPEDYLEHVVKVDKRRLLADLKKAVAPVPYAHLEATRFLMIRK